MNKREEIRRNKADKELRAQIHYYIEKYDSSKKVIAKEMEMSEATLYNKLRNPSKFTLGELRDLFFILSLDDKIKAMVV